MYIMPQITEIEEEITEIEQVIENITTQDTSDASTSTFESELDTSASEPESEPLKRIILIRHGESEWNATGSYEKNSRLTEYGKKCSGYLDFDVDLVVCSTLRRARETLDHSQIKYKNIVFTELCREFLDDNPVNHYNGEDVTHESIDELHERINAFKAMLVELQKKYNRIAVITHYCFLENMTTFKFNNCFYLNYSIDE